MRPKGSFQSLVATLSLLVLCAARAWAQAAPTPSSGSLGAGGLVGVVVLILVALLIVGGAVKLYDLRRRRESEAVQLQAQVSDALMREPLLLGVPIIATARAPLWRGSPPTMEIAGQVPSSQARETALRIVRAEANRIRPDVQIEDRLAVVPRHAA